MIAFQNLITQEISEAYAQIFEQIKGIMDESHRPTIFFDCFDESFFEWLALDEKHGNAFNHYKDQRELLDWSVYSLTQAYAILAKKQPRTYIWHSPSDISPRVAIAYYLDNALYRIFAAIERTYSFCDYWFELGLTNHDTGKLFHAERLFKEQVLNNHPAWRNSNLYTALEELRNSPEYEENIQRLRHDITHNLDPREYCIRYDKEQSLVEVANPNLSINKELLDQIKKILERLYKIRVLEAKELAQNMEQNGVYRITPKDQEYWSASDWPLF